MESKPTFTAADVVLEMCNPLDALTNLLFLIISEHQNPTLVRQYAEIALDPLQSLNEIVERERPSLRPAVVTITIQ